MKDKERRSILRRMLRSLKWLSQFYKNASNRSTIWDTQVECSFNSTRPRDQSSNWRRASLARI